MNSFFERYASIAVVLLSCAAAHAATTNTTLTVNATVSVSSTGSFNATGTANLTNLGSGGSALGGTFSATINIGANLTAPYTITVTGGTLTGTITLPASILTGATSATGSGTVTGGTGTFSGATGSFPSLSGSGTVGATIAVTFSGAGSITTGGSGGTPTPTIATVGSAADYSTTLAQGSLFIVKGTNLSASGFNQFNFPLPQTSGGVTINFTPLTGGTATPAYLIYTFNQNGVNQLAGILPSTLAPGNYNVTVVNGGATSAPSLVTVAARRFALFTQDASGTGLGIVQNFISAAQLDYNRFTTGSIPTGYTISPAKPGQALIAWGTGLGPVTGADNVASPAFNFAANGVNIQVVVGGVSITPAYAGRAPSLASEDQIVFTLPPDIPTGCTVPLQISVNNVLSPATFIAIAPSASATACVSPNFTLSQLQNFDQGGTVTTGGFSLAQISETVASLGSIKIDQASGAFVQYTGFQLGAIPPTTVSLGTSSGSCQVLQISGTTAAVVPGSGTNLDAGAVTLSGPSGSNLSNTALTETNNAYALTIGEEGLPAGTPGVGNGKIVPGTYTLNGAGGKDVGKFNASITLGTPLSITGGLPTTVNRSAGLTLNWTGGNSSDLVEIVGFSGSLTGTGANTSVNATEFFCTTTAGVGTFTVPSSILLQLPPAAAASLTASTFLEVATTPVPANGNGQFTAPLTAGGSVNATFLGLQATGGSPTYQ
jgi:fibronectin-binding autotransporter adhesin